MKTALFLCSGNYYRSRLAEIFFNQHAAERQLPWRAESRGFRKSPANVGPISVHALEALAARNLVTSAVEREPLVVTQRDFEKADLVIALKEAEHRPMMAARFPDWTERIEYWQIDDLDCAAPAEAIPQLERNVLALVSRLVGDNMAR